ncbi:MAG: heme lyase CcmF/NrfE family subunit [Porticoccaceae bacterium]|nr:heme lyase CcmF/NrfE family subunit [Porticoccaceae bacterium]
MIAELGHFALILALCLACAQAFIPLAGTLSHKSLWIATARPLSCGQFVFVAISFACLVTAFLQDDFSLAYVANNSNSLLPYYYKVSAVWGAHEGSLLLWVLILAGWTLAVAMFSRSLPADMVARVLSVMGMISVGFYLFMLLTSNPFERLLPFPPMDGKDLNPLLQDIGLIIHPPMLYMGYVGFSVAFAFAVAALMAGRMDSAWARWTRPWTNAAWSFLTVGIFLGSWWAYYELGWGGWWFWDPVENASLMPWLAGTALIHSLAVAEKRGLFRSWTLLLAILAFSLSLLGTFLVRSGVLTSVHAFATDPTRGVFILAFLGVVIGGSLLLFALRSSTLGATASFNWLSREAGLLLNNVLLVVALAMVLLGTLYPLLADVLGWGKISVGPPYFNFFFVPLGLLLMLAMGIGANLQWKRQGSGRLFSLLKAPLLLSPALAVLWLLAAGWSLKIASLLGLSAALWLTLLTLQDVWQKTSHSRGRRVALGRLNKSYWGMVTAHLGIAVLAIGITLTSNYSDQRDVRLVAGEHIEVAGYSFAFHSVEQIRGPNYIAQRGRFDVFAVSEDDGQGAELKSEREPFTRLWPEKRRYLATGNTMTEADIDGGLFRDLYVALGEPLGDGAWSVRVYVKPYIRWIWLGALMIALGGVIAAFDKRYRKARLSVKQSANTVSSEASSALALAKKES